MAQGSTMPSGRERQGTLALHKRSGTSRAGGRPHYNESRKEVESKASLQHCSNATLVVCLMQG